jgi:rRNA processing protein Krr1/Pno1
VTKNSHYVDSKGDMRITTTVIVPNYLVPYLIGKSGEVIKNIETKTTSKISFQREVRFLSELC